VADPVQSMVIVGDIVDGLTFYGPFPDHSEANEWASEESANSHGVIGNETWVVSVLNLP
jgi:hypothetical protein